MEIFGGDLLRSRSVLSIETICARPTPRVATDTVSIKDFLGRCHHLVHRVATGVCSVGIAAHLDCLNFR
ncbi:hypothetical protein [Mycobacterium avium]|uniref:hypothetical protein n=1 Tax=Mycobacterium avium TaxID=1764 RepID=UPI0003D2081D|nr:hypothetical protein [Mycobacterium avium]ETB03316.1 hypothetical protein P863_23250 [Mycobacterium avium subsp. silvaticum ATCC 49884]ETB09807.1 hypothetical protein O972_25135 [Mycobacterium avium subsp. avium 10-9275]ETB16596.1 hypothetical protein O973_23935 [Mycobacterium avium subsp. avium 11-4751]AYJ07420.1 hypothetical protein DBO90_23275 [Mycobacterium avium]UEA33624.1 hypothetical protein LK466_18475 [Mycobacterium avium subsp. avium]